MSPSLVAVSLLSAAAAPGIREVLRCCAAATGVEIVFDEAMPWEEGERRLDAGVVDVAFLCGLLCARKLDAGVTDLSIVAAPVMQGARYQDLPHYFSDVVVRPDHPATSFADLRGAHWGYNDPGSFSGHAIVRNHLLGLGEPRGYFSRATALGSHLAAIDAVLDGRVDAAAIDSTVLDHQPELAARLRVVHTLGPNPIPPLAISSRVQPALREALASCLFRLHERGDGRLALAEGKVRRYAPVENADYTSLLAKAPSDDAVSLI
jgi:phosphonate transport system substrate-binding protein